MKAFAILIVLLFSLPVTLIGAGHLGLDLRGAPEEGGYR